MTYNKLLEDLCKIAQTEKDESVKWNELNEVVQSHKDGTQYISIDKVIEFIYNANSYKEKDIIIEERNFVKELTTLINKFSKENGSNTPDYILAEYLDNCLINFNNTISKKEIHIKK